MQAQAIPVRPTRNVQTSRPKAVDASATRVHDWAQASGRMLVSGFFIASSVGNMGSGQFGLSAIAHAESSILLNAVIYSMAFAVLVGRFVHISALLLGLAMLWSSTAQLTNGASDLANYWQDLAIIGALFFMAASRGGSAAASATRAFQRGSAVAPRRVLPEGRSMVGHSQTAKVHVSRSHVARPTAAPMFISRRT